jgi:hypothetical protein
MTKIRDGYDQVKGLTKIKKYNHRGELISEPVPEPVDIRYKPTDEEKANFAEMREFIIQHEEKQVAKIPPTSKENGPVRTSQIFKDKPGKNVITLGGNYRT